MNFKELKQFLDFKADFYENPDFIESDPIQIPHRFDKKQDIEIAAFFSALLAWGNRKMIIRNASRLMELMDNSPYDFITNHKESDLSRFEGFVHRTFNEIDLLYYIQSLKSIYSEFGGLEKQFDNSEDLNVQIHNFKKLFMSFDAPLRSGKHLGDPKKGSAAKRLHMFLRWMVRSGDKGVDFGIWKEVNPSQLYCPLDIHSGNVARKLKLLDRKQNDQKALQELSLALKKLDPKDPVKYDFALFGLGVFEKF
jgi:uncharacterized protein (TIGR02757 family)